MWTHTIYIIMMCVTPVLIIEDKRRRGVQEDTAGSTTYKEKQEDANAMAHSVQVQQQHYVKVD